MTVQHAANRQCWLVVFALVAACSSDDADSGADAATSGSDAGSCTYDNPFSRSAECRDYTGANWDAATAEADCMTRSGTYASSACSTDEVLGRCYLDEGTPDAYTLVFPGSDLSACGASQTGCELFGGGRFEADDCAGPAMGDGGMPSDGGARPTFGGVFLPPTQSCVEPQVGEPAGMSEGNEVCTWAAIAGCTEPGRKFADYASCDTVRTQRPYYPAAPAQTMIDNDTRASDADYVDELAWVTEQVEACACVCCHESALTPGGPSNWYIDAPGIWVDTMGPEGLALAAGWVSSEALGAYPPPDNNGFERERAGLPTTDPDRMIAFFEAELARRGLTRDDFAETEPFGGPIHDQLVYVPETCGSDVGIDSSGAIEWSDRGARYLYVLAAGSRNPGVPPNLDLPEGTLWRVDVAPTEAPFDSGIRYGEVPAGASQSFPTSGAPEALVSGENYYLYVLADVGVPIERCLFTAP